jgi:hypothetical protein
VEPTATSHKRDRRRKKLVQLESQEGALGLQLRLTQGFIAPGLRRE